jgi:hypothetical protein
LNGWREKKKPPVSTSVGEKMKAPCAVVELAEKKESRCGKK